MCPGVSVSNFRCVTPISHPGPSVLPKYYSQHSWLSRTEAQLSQHQDPSLLSAILSLAGAVDGCAEHGWAPRGTSRIGVKPCSSEINGSSATDFGGAWLHSQRVDCYDRFISPKGSSCKKGNRFSTLASWNKSPWLGQRSAESCYLWAKSFIQEIDYPVPHRKPRADQGTSTTGGQAPAGPPACSGRSQKPHGGVAPVVLHCSKTVPRGIAARVDFLSLHHSQDGLQ